VVKLLVNWALLGVAFWLTTKIVPGLTVSGEIPGLIIAAAIFGLVNAFVGPILRLITLPLRIITLGLFSLIVNAVLLIIASLIGGFIHVDGFLTAIIAALVLTVITWALHLVFDMGRRTVKS
jgi:putative membrane protein